jgi:uncharacterized protein (DUF1810 family)
MQPIYNLERFLSAQESVYEIAYKELQNGKKQTHWMWFMFPQLAGLGRSEMARYYALKNTDEAKAYLQHEVLRIRLELCVHIVLSCNTSNPVRIFGEEDALKFHSCLTLFALVAPENELFRVALDKFFQGIMDYETENIIGK